MPASDASLRQQTLTALATVLQQHLDRWSRQRADASAASLATRQTGWAARALPNDLDDDAARATTPYNGEPAYAVRDLQGYNPLREDFHAWCAARLARLAARLHCEQARDLHGPPLPMDGPSDAAQR